MRSNLRLVVNIAKSFAGPGQTFGDRIEEGNIGLLRAVDTFDPAHEVRFSTYAAWWIRQAIKQAMLANSQILHIPTYMVDLLNHYRSTAQRLESRLGRAPMSEEIAAELHLPLKKIKAIEAICDTVASPFQADADDEAPGLEETVCDDRTGRPEDPLIDDEQLRRATELLDELEPRQAKILRMRFGLNGAEPLMLKDIGKKLRLTRERVRQLLIEALDELNQRLNGPE